MPPSCTWSPSCSSFMRTAAPLTIRAVGAAAVLDDESTVDELDDRVLARGLVVADANFVAESAADSDRLFADLEAGALIGPADHEERRLCRPGSLVRCHDDSTWLQPVHAPGGSVFRTPARRIVATIIATATIAGPKSRLSRKAKSKSKVTKDARKVFQTLDLGLGTWIRTRRACAQSAAAAQQSLDRANQLAVLERLLEVMFPGGRHAGVVDLRRADYDARHVLPAGGSGGGSRILIEMQHHHARPALGGQFFGRRAADAIDREAARLEHRSQHLFRLRKTVDDENALLGRHGFLLGQSAQSFAKRESRVCDCVASQGESRSSFVGRENIAISESVSKAKSRSRAGRDVARSESEKTPRIFVIFAAAADCKNYNGPTRGNPTDDGVVTSAPCESRRRGGSFHR